MSSINGLQNLALHGLKVRCLQLTTISNAINTHCPTFRLYRETNKQAINAALGVIYLSVLLFSTYLFSLSINGPGPVAEIVILIIYIGAMPCLPVLIHIGYFTNRSRCKLASALNLPPPAFSKLYNVILGLPLAVFYIFFILEPLRILFLYTLSLIIPN